MNTSSASSPSVVITPVPSHPNPLLARHSGCTPFLLIHPPFSPILTPLHTPLPINGSSPLHHTHTPSLTLTPAIQCRRSRLGQQSLHHRAGCWRVRGGRGTRWALEDRYVLTLVLNLTLTLRRDRGRRLPRSSGVKRWYKRRRWRWRC